MMWAAFCPHTHVETRKHLGDQIFSLGSEYTKLTLSLYIEYNNPLGRKGLPSLPTKSNKVVFDSYFVSSKICAKPYSSK